MVEVDDAALLQTPTVNGLHAGGGDKQGHRGKIKDCACAHKHTKTAHINGWRMQEGLNTNAFLSFRDHTARFYA